MMKQYKLILFILLATCTVTKGQMATGYGAGYSFQFGKVVGLNDMIQRYNQIQNPTTPMKNFSPNGIMIGLLSLDNTGLPSSFYDTDAFTTEKSFNFFELGYSTYRQTNSAIFAGTNGDNQQDLRVRMNGAYLGGGSSQFSIYGLPVAGGFRMNVGFLAISSRQGLSVSLDDADWNELYNELFVDMSLNLKLFVGPLIVEPYYTFSFDGIMSSDYFDNTGLNDITPVYEAFNLPVGTSEKTFMMSDFGLRLFLALGLYNG